MNQLRLTLAIVAAGVIGPCTAGAQTVTVLATGLNAPMKLIVTPAGNLLVSEATLALNTGRVSIVDRSGVRRSLLEGLPSGPGITNAPLGPAALALDGRTLYVSILEGNALVPGAVAGSLPVPNPAGPASPIFSSILRVRLGDDVDRMLTTFVLTLNDQFTLADGWPVKLTNKDGQTATVEMLADFPDIPLDRREIYGHVTPYGMTLDPARQYLYAADAGQNRVIKVDVSTGRWETLVRFPRIPRVPATATATETDSVPTSASFYGDELLVTFLSGAPFAAGTAAVRIVNLETREPRPFINWLTTSTDLVYRDTPAGPQFWVLEARHVLVGAPNTGRVIQFDSPQGRVIADALQGPTGLAQDPATGDLFVAEFFGGRITRIRLQ